MCKSCNAGILDYNASWSVAKGVGCDRTLPPMHPRQTEPGNIATATSNQKKSVPDFELEMHKKCVCGHGFDTVTGLTEGPRR